MFALENQTGVPFAGAPPFPRGPTQEAGLVCSFSVVFEAADLVPAADNNSDFNTVPVHTHTHTHTLNKAAQRNFGSCVFDLYLF